jgi:hypothetical protein
MIPESSLGMMPDGSFWGGLKGTDRSWSLVENLTVSEPKQEML